MRKTYLIILALNLFSTSIFSQTDNKDKKDAPKTVNKDGGTSTTTKKTTPIDVTLYSDMQKSVYNKIMDEEIQGIPLSNYKIFYNSTNATSDKSLYAKIWVVVPGVTVPLAIGGTFSDENQVGMEADPLVGIGFSFRRETLIAKTTTLSDGLVTKYNFCIDPFILLSKYDAALNRFSPVVGCSINLLRDYAIIGYGYSIRPVPGFNFGNYFFLGTNINLAGISPTQKEEATTQKLQ